MKLYHFIMIFAIIALSITAVLDIKTSDLKAVVKSKEQIDQKLDTAIDDGVIRLARVDDNNNVIIDKEAAVNSFFVSLNSTFNILSDQDAIQKLNLYVPVVVVTMEEGYYIFYSDTYKKSDGNTYLSKRWSEKFPYSYEDDDFIYSFTLGDTVKLYDKNRILDVSGTQSVFELDYHELQTQDEYASFRSNKPDSLLLSDKAFETARKGTLINCIESSMADYTSRHNRIASQYGITYNFSLPVIREEEWEGYLDTNSMFVVFQGYPYGDETGETYNRVASSAAMINKNDVYYLEQKGWYLIYHKSTCPELKKDSTLQLSSEPYYSVEDCAKAGAYACPRCNQQGVFAPAYTP